MKEFANKLHNMDSIEHGLQRTISDDILLLEQKEREEAFEKVKNLRWIVLLISCFMIFGDYYAYDTPYAVKFYLRKSYSSYSRTDFNYLFATLYAVYDFPNIILPLINGYLASKVGIKKMMTFFIFFITIGVIIVTVGVYTVSFPVLLVGRIFYGLGGDSLLVTQWAYIAEFFNEDKIGVASGFITMFTGISESANLFFSPKMASRFGLGAPFVFTAILCFCGFLARILLGFIDNKIRKHIPQVASLSLESLVPVRNSLFPSREDLRFPKSFYLVLWFGITTSVSYYGFYYLAYDFLDSTWFAHMSLINAQNEASLYTSISSALKTLGVVLLGYLADRYKLYILYAIAAPLILTMSYMLALIMPPLVPFLLFGFGGALSQISFWTCLSIAVNEKKILVGAAVMYSLMNGLFATIQYINTFFYQIYQTYDPAIYFFSGLNLFALIGALIFWRHMNKKQVQ